MGLSLQQVHRQTQQLIMTPQMQQSIQLLQMNTLELEQLAQAELLENPFLQLEEERDDGGVEPSAEKREETGGEPEPGADAENMDYGEPELRGSADGAEADNAAEDMFTPVEREVLATVEADPEFAVLSDLSSGGEGMSGSSGEGEPAGDDSPETVAVEDHPEQFSEVDLNWEDYYDDSDSPTYAHDPNEEERDFSEFTAARVSLFEHLMWQLRLSSLEGQSYEIGEYLIGCIDDDGYLSTTDLDEAVAKFGVERKVVEKALSIIQEFEPPGIAARTPSECLLNQMRALGSHSETARRVIEEHFEDLQRKRFKNIAKALDVEEEVILDIYHKVGRLEPKPGRAFTKESPQYIEPDVVVKVIDGKLAIYLNEGDSGRLSINRYYRRLLRLQQQAITREDKAYALEKFRGALMLIKNIEKRKSTILRVTEAIMDVQREFLDKGVEALKPLTLREVADMVGMHESTIARVTSKKYVETPQGVYLLKFFFSSSIGTSDGSGDAVSSRAIKDKLSGLIEREEPRKPLSDQKIAEMLNKEGFNIARRTVAKYREQLKILPAKLRRRA